MLVLGFSKTFEGRRLKICHGVFPIFNILRIKKMFKKKTTFCHTWEITLKDDILSFPIDVYEQEKLYFSRCCFFH